MGEWRRVVLDDLIRMQRGYDLPTPKRRNGKVPIVGAAGISGSHDTPMVSGPGVVVGRSGASIGQSTYVDQDFWPLNTSLFVTDFRGNDPKFIHYLLTQIDFSGFNSGAAQPSLNRNYVRQIPLTVPLLGEQRRIVQVLGALDDKIAVNNRIASACDMLGQVIASEGVESAVALSGIVSVERDQILPSALGLNMVEHYSLPAFDSGQLPESCAPDSIRSGKFRFSGAAVLLSKLNPATPRVWNVVTTDTCSVASTEFLVLKSRGEATATEVWSVCSQPSFTGTLAEKATGTSNSHQRVKPADILATEVIDPRALSDLSRGRINILAGRARSTRYESVALRRLQDALLPGLMSGRLRVRDAERVVEGAV